MMERSVYFPTRSILSQLHLKQKFHGMNLHKVIVYALSSYLTTKNYYVREILITISICNWEVFQLANWLPWKEKLCMWHSLTKEPGPGITFSWTTWRLLMLYSQWLIVYGISKMALCKVLNLKVVIVGSSL